MTSLHAILWRHKQELDITDQEVADARREGRLKAFRVGSLPGTVGHRLNDSTLPAPQAWSAKNELCGEGSVGPSTIVLVRVRHGNFVHGSDRRSRLRPLSSG
jgi:hypothetical protein